MGPSRYRIPSYFFLATVDNFLWFNIRFFLGIMRTFWEGFRAYVTGNLNLIIVGEKRERKKWWLDNSISLSLPCVNPYVLFSFPMGVVWRYCLHSCSLDADWIYCMLISCCSILFTSCIHFCTPLNILVVICTYQHTHTLSRSHYDRCPSSRQDLTPFISFLFHRWG